MHAREWGRIYGRFPSHPAKGCVVRASEKYAKAMAGGLWDSKEAAEADKEDFRTVVETWGMNEKDTNAFYKACQASGGPPTARTDRYVIFVY